jgi:predicted Zn-dependent peptidase
MRTEALYRKSVLENGVRIISERVDHMRSVALGIWAHVGSRDEANGNAGIAHFIEHMLFKGTSKRSGIQIALELDSLGGFHNAFTGKETTCFHGRVLGRHFPQLADILSDIFLHSVFDPTEIERERQVVLQEINMVEDTPDEYIHELFNALIWKGHPMGLPILGHQDSVSRLERKNILSFMDMHYTTDRLVVTSAGRLDHEALLAFFEPMLGRLEGSRSQCKRTAPQAIPAISVMERDLEQVHLCIGAQAPSLSDPKRFACAILNTILGGNMSSRLFQEVREKKALAYNIYSFMNTFSDTGALGIYAATDPAKIQETLETIRIEAAKIIRGEVSATDLGSAREHLTASLYLSSESAESRMMRLAKNEFLYGRDVSYEEIVERLEAVTVDDVVEVAGDIFGAQGITVAALGPLTNGDLDCSLMSFN